MRLRAGLAVMAVATAWAGTAAAQDAYIRIEAKRGAAAETAAEGWAERFPDVVTFTLPNGMTGIALGPLGPGEAAARMAELKAAGEIPQDSFVTAVADAEPVAAVGGEAAAPEAGPGGFEAALDRFAPGAEASTVGFGETVPEPGGAEAEQPETPAVEPVPPAAMTDTYHIQLQSTPGATAGVELLAQWRERFPDAGLWLQPGGWYSIALAAQPEAEAQARLDALIRQGRIPADAFLTATSGMGEVIDAPTEAEAVAESPAGVEPDAAAGDPEPEADAQAEETGAAAPEAEAVAEEPIAREPAGTDGVPSDTIASDEGQAEIAKPVEAEADAEDTTAKGELTGEAASPRDTATDEAEPDTSEETATPYNITAPSTPAVMPPIEDIQQALRWAGYYDGPIDGISGPGTQAAIGAEIEAVSPGATPAEAMTALLARREAWREEMGLWPLRDAETGITLTAPTARLAFDRVEHGLSIYGPKDGSGAALILFAQEGDAATMNELAGFVTALGWVPNPERVEERNRLVLEGADDDHHSRAELRLVDGVVEGFVLIWPAADADNARRLGIEAAASFEREPVAGE